jgi:hypothetical protein
MCNDTYIDVERKMVKNCSKDAIFKGVIVTQEDAEYPDNKIKEY